MTPDNEILQAMRGRNSTTPDTEGEFSTADYKGTRYLARGGKIVSCYPIDTPDTEEKSPQQEWIDRAKEDIDTNLKHMNNQPIFNTPDTEWEKEFIEKGADLEHTRWAKWQAYLHSKCVEHENGKGEWVCFPAELFRRWERQINTQYSQLTENEKDSDRAEAETYLPIVRNLLSSRDTYWKERVKERDDYWYGIVEDLGKSIR